MALESDTAQIPRDFLRLQQIRAYGYTGALPEEQVLGQWFTVDLAIALDLSKAGQSDLLADTLDYRQVIGRVQTLIRTARFALVERLATAIAETVLEQSSVATVTVYLTKEAPPIPDFSGQICVEITRSRAAQDD